jgi:hypothetical protein
MSKFQSEANEIFKNSVVSRYLDIANGSAKENPDIVLLDEDQISAIVDLLWQTGDTTEPLKALETFLKDAGL